MSPVPYLSPVGWGPSAHALGLQDGIETGGFAASGPSAHALGLQDDSEKPASRPGRVAAERPPNCAAGPLCFVTESRH